MGPHQLIFFSLGAAFLSLAPSNAIGYYATATASKPDFKVMNDIIINVYAADRRTICLR